jgi:ornithine carbamoyltransferase
MMRHFLSLEDLSTQDIEGILAEALHQKNLRKTGSDHCLRGKSLAMIFEKNSTRTRVSFEVAMAELGGHAIMLRKDDLQLGRGETVADTARVLSRYVHAIMLRANHHNTLIELAKYADVPVINGLTDYNHPCQVLADILTIQERLSGIRRKNVAWIGDGNNMAASWINAAMKLDFTLNLACPEGHAPNEKLLEKAVKQGARVSLSHDPKIVAKDADVITTDTWVSMGDDDTLSRREAFAPFQVNAQIMQLAKPSAIFLHCLPAHRGEEVTSQVLDGPQSAIWDEAENRLHIQKAILKYCFAAA